jgi:hypothetical protein
MKITPKAMNFEQFEEYADFLAGMEKDKVSNFKKTLESAKWVAEKIYNIDVKTAKVTPGTILDLLVKTKDLTETSQLEEEKN